MGSFSLFPYEETFIDLTLIQFGWEQCEPLHSYGPHMRENFLLHYVFSGTGYVEYNVPRKEAIRYWVPPKSAFLICPGQVTTYCADQNNPWEYAWIEFNGMQAQYRLKQAGLDEDSPLYTADSEESTMRVEKAFRELVTDPKANVLEMIGRLYFLFDALIRSSLRPTRVRNQGQNSYYVNEAITFIHRNYAKKITMDDIASFLGLSRTHLGRLFKKVTGKTLQSYLTLHRIARAVDLMRTTSLQLSEIAIRVGYSNQLYFSKVFRSIYGMPPSVWRQQDLIAQKHTAKARHESHAGKQGLYRPFSNERNDDE